MAKKPERRFVHREVVYDAERWNLFKMFRQKATLLMEALKNFHLDSVVHGSIARGDVNRRSDVDIFILNQPSSFIVETALDKAGISANRRLIVQATPSYAMKAYIEIGENTCVSFPLMKMRKVEKEFYKFGGDATLENLSKNIRVPGVDKRLMLIEPTQNGHRESSVVGREEQIAKQLGISVETVLDRVHALLRRDEVGRTGVFIEKELSTDENFEMALKRLADENPAVRRRLKSV
ncbi:nucleotidyltransferase domain-containing protein [Candidatus Bathyarchaeota archaeon]|nr:nucleotidyltransferase domain-containing protein [Candidatus Bathyarchaeota archaeon]